MSVLKYKNDQGQWIGVPSLKGEQGVSVSNVEVTSAGHLKTTMSDGSTIDAGAVPQIITSVNGKVGAVELTASDVGAPTTDEIVTMSNAIGIGESIVKTTPMFGTVGVDVELGIGITTEQNVYVYMSSAGSLADGQTITVTPYWNGILGSTYATSEMTFDKWYVIKHPMAGMNASLPKIQIKTNVDGVMSTGVIYIRYAPHLNVSNKVDLLVGALACDSVATDSFTSLSSQATALTFGGSAHTKNEAYVCITTGSSIKKVKITPTYSGAAYSGGSITNAEPGIWYKLAFPPGMTGTEFTLGLQLVLTSGNSTSGIVTLRYISTTTSTS